MKNTISLIPGIFLMLMRAIILTAVISLIFTVPIYFLWNWLVPIYFNFLPATWQNIAFLNILGLIGLIIFIKSIVFTTPIKITMD